MSWDWFVTASVVVTLAAGVVTLISVSSYFATRPRIEVRLNEPGVVAIYNNGPSQSIKNVRMGFATLSTQGHARGGSGADPWGGEIFPKTGRWMFLRASDEPDQLGPRFHDGYVNEVTVERGGGIIIEFYWQHPIIPWLIQRTIVLSEPASDISKQKAVKLPRRKGNEQWKLRVDAGR